MDIASPDSLGRPATAPPLLHGLQTLATLRRGWWLILACGVALSVALYVAAHHLTPSYTAASVVSVEPQRFAIPQLQGAVASETSPDPMPWVRTEAAALRSPSLIRATARDVGLHGDPVFNPALRPPGMRDHMREWLAGIAPGLVPTVAPREGLGEEMVLEETMRRLAVSHDERTFLVSISFAAPDPGQSAEFVNTLVRLYIEERSTARSSANRGAHAAINERLDQLRTDMETAERQLRELRLQHGMVTLRAGSLGQQQLEELATAAARASADRIQAQVAWERASELMGRGAVGELADVVGSATMARLRDQEAAAARRWAEVQSRLGTNHPDRRSAQSELAAVRSEIAEESRRVSGSLQARFQAARDREAATTEQLAAARQEAARAGVLRDQLADVEREVESRRTLYRNLLEQAERTALDPQNGGHIPGLRVVSTAVPPAQPSSPKPLLAAVLGLVGGSALGGVLALARGRRPVGFDGEEEIAGETGLPVVATLPIPGGLLRGRRRWLAELPLRVLDRRTSPEANALSLLRRRVWQARSSAAPCAVAFLSLEPGVAEAVAAAFGRTAAGDGDRPLLVEGEAPALRHLDPPRTGAAGLPAVTSGAIQLRDAVHQDPESTLRVLPRGTPPGRRGEKAAGFGTVAGCQNLLIDANGAFNLVVLSASGRGQAAEALLLARVADLTVLLVDRAGENRAEIAELARRLRAGARDPVVAVLGAG